MKTIRIACDVKDHAPLDDLEPFQGNLKSLSDDAFQGLRKEIIETGFAFPIMVWQSPEGVKHILGGHQRVATLKAMRDKDGFVIPGIPIVYVEADSFAQAKRRILQDVSQYGKIEGQGLYEFMIENDLDPGKIAGAFRLPDIDLLSFNAEFFLDGIVGTDATGSKELGEQDFSAFDHKCPRCGFQFDE